MNTENILRSLEITFGNVPKQIRENVKYLSYRDDSDDFVCNPCNKVIKIGHDNLDVTTSNFEKHLLSVAHQALAVTEVELVKELNKTFMGQIPQIVRNNTELLDLNESDYECSICDKIIKVTGNPTTIEANFSYHLTSAGHEENLESYRDCLSELHNLYGGIPQVVLNHKQYLTKYGKHYICKICDKQIMVHPSSVCETEKSFEKHLHSLKHMRKAKEEKAFSLHPQLKYVFNPLPRYMMKNIEYISVNGFNFFCLLCNENIKNSHEDTYETRQNFKLHYLSNTHEEKLNNRRETNRTAYQIIDDNFNDLPVSVINNLKFLTVNEDNYFCNICHCTILENEYTEHNLTTHFESSDHLGNVDNERRRQSVLINELKHLFGGLPQLIEENMRHIEYRGANRFECILCNKTMISKDSEEDNNSNANTTEKNFTCHLESNKHCKELNELDEIYDDVLTDLNDLFFPIPQFIINNLKHICYSDDDFCCILCDKTIQIVNGNKKKELTEQNFRIHLLSSSHIAKLKQKANQTMEATDVLQTIFNKVPDFVSTNIEYIELNGNTFNCALCDVSIVKKTFPSTLEKQFRQHLFGKFHKSNLEEKENGIDEALDRIDQSFHRVPEFLLRNIDFLLTSDDDDLFCMLCQMYLPIDDDITESRQELRDHFESSFHTSYFKNL